MTVAEHKAGLSDGAMHAATGRHPNEWFAILDEQGATGWAHTKITRWLSAHHGEVDGWWIQSVTVRYEQSRGMRAPGQMADGTFSAGASKTITGDQQHALERAVAAVTEHFAAEPSSVNPGAKHPTARWKTPEGETVLATISPTRNGRTSITLTHSRISDPERVGEAKATLASVLKTLASMLD